MDPWLLIFPNHLYIYNYIYILYICIYIIGLIFPNQASHHPNHPLGLSGAGRGLHRDLREGLRLRGIPALGLRGAAEPRHGWSMQNENMFFYIGRYYLHIDVDIRYRY